MKSVKIYGLIDQILTKNKIYEEYDSLKSAVESIGQEMINSENNLDYFLTKIPSYRQEGKIRSIRADGQFIQILQQTNYCQCGISQTALINALLLAYLKREKKVDFSNVA